MAGISQEDERIIMAQFIPDGNHSKCPGGFAPVDLTYAFAINSPTRIFHEIKDQCYRSFNLLLKSIPPDELNQEHRNMNHKVVKPNPSQIVRVSIVWVKRLNGEPLEETVLKDNRLLGSLLDAVLVI
jgi:hypothetical protein